MQKWITGFLLLAATYAPAPPLSCVDAMWEVHEGRTFISQHDERFHGLRDAVPHCSLICGPVAAEHFLEINNATHGLPAPENPIEISHQISERIDDKSGHAKVSDAGVNPYNLAYGLLAEAAKAKNGNSRLSLKTCFAFEDPLHLGKQMDLAPNARIQKSDLAAKPAEGSKASLVLIGIYDRSLKTRLAGHYANLVHDAGHFSMNLLEPENAKPVRAFFVGDIDLAYLSGGKHEGSGYQISIDPQEVATAALFSQIDRDKDVFLVVEAVISSHR